MLVLSPGRALRNACASLLHRGRLGSGVFSCLAVRERTSWLALWRSQRENRGEIGAERARIASGSQIANTPCGPIEYAVAGSGPNDLLIHYAAGGFDHGLALWRPIVYNHVPVLALSLFG